jgi:hypothetical protein
VIEPISIVTLIAARYSPDNPLHLMLLES